MIGHDGTGSIENDRDSRSDLRWAVEDDGTVDFTATPAGLALHWRGRMEVVGLVGHAAFREQTFVLELVPR